MKMQYFGLALVFLCLATASAWAVPVKDISTGFDDSTSAKLANNASDTDYVIGQGSFMFVGETPIARSAPLPNVFIPDSDSAASRWIAIDTGVGIEGINTTPGQVFFDIQVDTTGFDASMVQISNLRYAVDNRLNEIFINGVSVWTPPTGFPVGNEFTWGNVGDLGLGSFQAGVNTIRFAVENTGSFPTPLAFRMEALVEIPDVPVAPAAADDSFSGLPGQTLNVTAPGVLANDTDGNNDPLTAVVSAQPSSGTLTLNADGSFSYTPNTGFSGNDSFTYFANDGTSQSNAATVTITINAPPAAADDAYQVQSGLALNVNAPGVLGNDSDTEGDPLTAVLISGPTSAASFALNPNGSFSYTSVIGFTGTDSFTYTADDAAGSSNTATVTISVVPDPLECIALLRGPADAYAALIDATLAAQIPAIGALLASGDVSGANALKDSTTTMLVQEAGNTSTAIQTECANCAAQLQADGNEEFLPTVEAVCIEELHRVGVLQAGAILRLESAISPVQPPRIALAIRNRYLREIQLNADRTVAATDLFAERYVTTLQRYVARGNSAAADSVLASATRVLQTTREARVRRIQMLCDNFVARASTMPGTHRLIEEITTAAGAAMAEIRIAEADAMQQIRDARLAV